MKQNLHLISLLLLGFLSISTVHAQYDYMSIVGDATPTGWDANGIQLNQNGNVFTFKGELKAGDFKFHAFYGEVCEGDWINSTENGQALTATDYIVTTGCEGPDNKWSVPSTGSYSITIDLDASTIQISELAYYTNLSLVGDATPGGWSLDLASDMQVDELNPALFTWTGDLVSGDFKIATVKTFDNGWDWLMPLTQGQDFGLTNYQVTLSGSGTDNKWTIGAEDAGKYDIKVDLESETIVIGKSAATNIPDFDLSKTQVWFNETNGQLNVDLGAQTEGNITVYSNTGSILTKTKGMGAIVFHASSLGVPGLKLVQVSTNQFTKVFKVMVR
jgi:hypothetical protein